MFFLDIIRQLIDFLVDNWLGNLIMIIFGFLMLYFIIKDKIEYKSRALGVALSAILLGVWMLLRNVWGINVKLF